MAGKLAIKTGKSGPKSVPTPGLSPSFVRGSRPRSLQPLASPLPRVAPLGAQTREYGKAEPGFGDTGMTSRS